MVGLLAFSLIRNDQNAIGFSSWSAASSIGFAVALLPGAYWAVRGMLGRPDPEARIFPRTWLLIALLLPLTLAIGHAAFRSEALAGQVVVGPLAHIGTSLIAAALVLGLILRGEGQLSLKDVSLFLTVGLTVIPLLAIVAEGMVLLPAGVLGAAWLVSTSEGLELIQTLMSAGADPTAISPALVAEWMQRPAIVAAVFAFTAGIVPPIEEVAKTAAVWPSMRRGLSPRRAFVVGALAGAGYGLFEALFLSQPGPEWLSTAIGRLGATFMHSATAGITSWGLMEWARDRRWMRALGAYAVSVLSHAIWNVAALSAGYEALVRETSAPAQAPAPTAITALSTAVLIGLSLASVFLLARGIPADSPHPESPSSGA
ncbi:MAG TPA: PrsW family glutamic-type intramembrane protease [Anaerolineales bacterium]|nr:PrsW family glutamic-type intramembrane protease [Anaerolineales bacterium]